MHLEIVVNGTACYMPAPVLDVSTGHDSSVHLIHNRAHCIAISDPLLDTKVTAEGADTLVAIGRSSSRGPNGSRAGKRKNLLSSASAKN
jgi:hypothetical protein